MKTVAFCTFYSLFNDVSISGNISSISRMFDELRRIWREADEA
jgi:hypothetical protein